MEDKKKTQLFEETPIPRAVMTLAIPTILSSLVMFLLNYYLLARSEAFVQAIFQNLATVLSKYNRAMKKLEQYLREE